MCKIRSSSQYVSTPMPIYLSNGDSLSLVDCLTVSYFLVFAKKKKEKREKNVVIHKFSLLDDAAGEFSHDDLCRSEPNVDKLVKVDLVTTLGSLNFDLRLS